MLVKPPQARHSTQVFSDKLIITIPTGRYWFVGLVRCLSIALWVLSDGLFIYFLIVGLAEQPPLVFTITMLVGIAIFTGFTAAYAYAVIWEFNGREMVEITKPSMTIGKEVLGRSSPKEYSADSIKDLRAVPSNTTRNRPGFAWIYSSLFPIPRAMVGSLAFDYGAKTVQFGAGVAEAEAKQILAEIQQKFPQSRS